MSSNYGELLFEWTHKSNEIGVTVSTKASTPTLFLPFIDATKPVLPDYEFSTINALVTQSVDARKREENNAGNQLKLAMQIKSCH